MAPAAARKEALLDAVIFGHNDDRMDTPLLDHNNLEEEQYYLRNEEEDYYYEDDEDDNLDETRMYTRFQVSSLLLGLLVGFFIQFSTLGANFLVITMWGEDVISKSKRDIVVFSLIWSFFTSAMAIIILGFLRNLIAITFAAFRSTGRYAHYVSEHHEILLQERLDGMILQMECRFVIGALIGVCMAWTLTDILLGMQAQILYSVLTLAAALFWCRIMMLCFARKESKKRDSTITRFEKTIMIV